MIKLKKLLKEFTEYNFKPLLMQRQNSKNMQNVVNTLRKAGFSKLSLKKSQKQIMDLDMSKSQGVMFVHMQYHVVEGKDGKKYFIYQTQYYHRDFGDGGVNLTALRVEERPNWPDKGPEEDIGSAVVLTSDFLDGLKKVKVLDRAF